MLTLSSTAPSPQPAAYDRADAHDASREAVSARTAAKAVEQAFDVKGDKPLATNGAAAGVMDGLSTIAMVGASLGSIPAALQRMRDIAVSASSGTLSEADRATLEAEYSQLSHQVSSVVGSATGADAGTSSKDKRNDDPSNERQGEINAPSQPTASTAEPATAAPRTHSKTVDVTKIVSTTVSGNSHAEVATHVAHASVGAYHPIVVTDAQTTHAAAVAQFQQHFATQKILISLVA